MAYPLLLLEILKERGLPHEQACRDSGIAAHVLARPEARVTPTQWTRLALNLVRLTGEPGMGIEFGLRMRPSAHGFLGYAAMTAPTLRAGIDLTIRYFRTRLRHYRVHLTEEGGRAILDVAAVHPVPVLRGFFVEGLLVGLAQLAGPLIGESYTGEAELWFDWPEPEYFSRYRHRLPRARFSQAATQLRFPAAYLERRLMLSDDMAHRQALTQVEREDATVKQDEGDIVARVRAELVLTPSGYLSFEQLAQRLCVSSRTLRRKLTTQDTGYQPLLDEARRRDACRLLEASALNLEAISSQLGFHNPANFTRAFKQWTGRTPSAHRRERQASDHHARKQRRFSGDPA